MENLEVDTGGTVKVKLGTDILEEFEEIGCEGFLLIVDIEKSISVEGNIDIKNII